jgi:hypothetical protein
VVFDLEKERAEREEQDRKDREEITALTAELENILANPDMEIPALERQGDLLDCILYTLLRRNLRRDRKRGTIDFENLENAMRIQKQCVDTLKASAAIDYMDAVRSLSTGIYPARLAPPGTKIHSLPTPSKPDERTIIIEGLTDGEPYGT